ncbi:chorismate--pyruvate lyase family protein [Tolumonas lignilytica]|uniref:chorismate--pyruvate lyase family protein n=1 Tax=Tolumonas lignilytica TaxID=1283284 RepID=UPI0009DDDB39|nr:chorismate lyase [Tolumonas lignilytica]
MRPQYDLLTDVEDLDQLVWLSATSMTWPERYADWLFDPTSLTAKLCQHTSQLRVHLLTSGWIPSKATSSTQLMRQVLLSDDERPWIWGLTQVTTSQLQNEPDLLNWKAQPLGTLLFAAAEEQNSCREFEVADFSTQASFAKLLPQWGCTETHPLWGRRSTVCFRSCQLSLTEVFLPQHPMYGV